MERRGRSTCVLYHLKPFVLPPCRGTDSYTCVTIQGSTVNDERTCGGEHGRVPGPFRPHVSSHFHGLLPLLLQCRCCTVRNPVLRVGADEDQIRFDRSDQIRFDRSDQIRFDRSDQIRFDRSGRGTRRSAEETARGQDGTHSIGKSWSRYTRYSIS